MSEVPTPSIEAESTGKDKLREVRFEHSAHFPDLLQQLRLNLLVTTYQAGKLLVIGGATGKLSIACHNFEQVMGVAVAKDQIAVGTRRQVYFLNSAHDCAAHIVSDIPYDQCWISRKSFVTGSIHGHDLAWGKEGLWVVNTLFSSLCTLSDKYNFVPRWRPPFVSKLIDQDRCHLNGLALEAGVPRYVTVLGVTDEPAGWRSNKASGGAIIDVLGDQTIARNLCMPHSPRVHNQQLLFCDSGRGHVSRVDRTTGHVETIASVPGYTRGLALHGDYAFVGLSKIRETNIFGGLPIGELKDELRCGVGVIELSTGRTVATLQFHSGVEEIFAVEVLPHAMHAKLVGPTLEEAGDKEVWIVPSQNIPIHVDAPEKSTAKSTESGTSFSVQPSTDAMADALVDVLISDKPPQSTLDAQTLMQHGQRAHEHGKLQEALRWYTLALDRGSPSADLLSQLGNLHQDLDDSSAAMTCYLRAAELKPNHSPTQQNLGVLYSTQNQPLRALHHFGLAQQANPHPMNFVLGANVLPIIYESNEHLNYWRERLTARVNDLVATGVTIDTTENVIPTSFFYAYQGQNDRPLMEQLAQVYKTIECCEAAQGQHRSTGKRLRVGFVSSYFCNHTIGRLNLGVIERLSRAEFEVNVISLRAHRDGYAERYRQAADNFVELPRQPSVVRRAIADMGLDILIFTDVGMDCLTQTLCYSRMAPIQAVTWGHPDTTGSPAIDFYISSELAEPPDAASHYSEQLELLPAMGVYYPRPSISDPPGGKAHFGLDSTRRVYLCPQTLFKFHPGFDEVLKGILESDPEGDVLIIQSRNASWNESLLARWRRILPDADRRFRFIPAQPREEFLRLLRIADVMLDPFPFCGGNTTYEALAMETPVVTLPDRFLRGRLTAAMYRRMNIEMMVVSSPQQYIDLSVRIATDPSTGQEARRAIRETNSVLYENPSDVLSYERLLKKWCGRE